MTKAAVPSETHITMQEKSRSQAPSPLRQHYLDPIKESGNTHLQAGVKSLAIGLALAFTAPATAEETTDQGRFSREVKPILQDFCYDCHGDGASKGGVAFDGFESETAIRNNRDLWQHALKLLRADIMPPFRKSQPSDDQKRVIEDWIKSEVFGIDFNQPDPGKITVRRLNRVEYRNTIHEMLGVEFDAGQEFPPDDSGHGFDNIADVLTISPMLMEKYIDAAQRVILKTVPLVSGIPIISSVAGDRFRPEGDENAPGKRPGTISLSYYSESSIRSSLQVPHDGTYRLVADLTANERYVDNQFDYNKCKLTFKLNSETLFEREFAREGAKPFAFEFERELTAGQYELQFNVEPTTPGERQIRSLSLRINAVRLVGPLENKYFVHPEGYEKIFPRDVPADKPAQREYAAALIREFATKAFRRPVDDRIVHKLVGLAEATQSQPGKTFEAGIAQAMVAVLVSPRFLFRQDIPEPLSPGQKYPNVDEYSLASRLSYFLWSSIPDAELLHLARKNQLRSNLTAQVKRMLADPRSVELMRNFTGQWLQARDIASVPIIARDVLSREAPPREELIVRFKELRGKTKSTLTEAEEPELEKVRSYLFPGSIRVDLTDDLRASMGQETERFFQHVIHENRSLLELLDSDYTFLDSELAKHYGIPGVSSEEMQRVALGPNSPRGGVLTQGTILAVTSNPTRTSPVKRGLFILENILGTPPAPPPPNIPALEETAKEAEGRALTLRETLALHREKPLCASCHNRMDPLGLALEQFNAMGMWRDRDTGQDIAVQGTLITGESFTSIKELKRILVTKRAKDFYHCLTEKMLTYALGRGTEFYDTHAIDEIVSRLVASEGRAMDLIQGIVESTPFQKTRVEETAAANNNLNQSQRVAGLN